MPVADCSTTCPDHGSRASRVSYIPRKKDITAPFAHGNFARRIVSVEYPRHLARRSADRAVPSRAGGAGRSCGLAVELLAVVVKVKALRTVFNGERNIGAGIAGGYRDIDRLSHHGSTFGIEYSSESFYLYNNGQ